MIMISEICKLNKDMMFKSMCSGLFGNCTFVHFPCEAITPPPPPPHDVLTLLQVVW